MADPHNVAAITQLANKQNQYRARPGAPSDFFGGRYPDAPGRELPAEAAWNRPVQGQPGNQPAGMPPASQMVVARAFRNRK